MLMTVHVTDMFKETSWMSMNDVIVPLDFGSYRFKCGTWTDVSLTPGLDGTGANTWWWWWWWSSGRVRLNGHAQIQQRDQSSADAHDWQVSNPKGTKSGLNSALVCDTCRSKRRRRGFNRMFSAPTTFQVVILISQSVDALVSNGSAIKIILGHFGRGSGLGLPAPFWRWWELCVGFLNACYHGNSWCKQHFEVSPMGN